MPVENAIIKSADVEIAYGKTTFFVYVSRNIKIDENDIEIHDQQGFGGIVLDDVFPLCRIMGVIGVRRWGDLSGKPCRVFGDGEVLHGIGNFINDDWYYLPGKEPKN